MQTLASPAVSVGSDYDLATGARPAAWGWGRRWTDRQTAIGGWGMLAAAAATFAWSPGQGLTQVVFIAGLVGLGVPHGVFDIDLALWAFGPGRRRGLAGLVAVYVALALVVMIGWRTAAGPTLAAFLLASVVHFGFSRPFGLCGRAWMRIVLGLALGGAPIVLPCMFHPAEVAPLLAALGGCTTGAMTDILARIAPAALAAWASCALAAVLGLVGSSSKGRRFSQPELIELVGLAALFATAPPLFAFALYFCGVHAVRHLLGAAAMARPDAPGPGLAWAACRVAPAALVTACVFALAVRLDPRGSPDLAVFAFRALAALTLPHLVLTPWLERRAAFNGYGGARDAPAQV